MKVYVPACSGDSPFLAVCLKAQCGFPLQDGLAARFDFRIQSGIVESVFIQDSFQAVAHVSQRFERGVDFLRHAEAVFFPREFPADEIA